MCGGTPDGDNSELTYVGLSPRVRGNPGVALVLLLGVGSIPACAGEPLRRRVHTVKVRVYPRVCGGTEADDGGDPVVSGSIPACAGEPYAAQP